MTNNSAQYPLASIVINNYNYGNYVQYAIESALHQSYQLIEIIVVDDGSTDDSIQTINKYQNKAKIISKNNGGQGSAFNAGFKASNGEVIIFLDADDALLPEAVTIVVENFKDAFSKIHWPLLVINEAGIPTGDLTPNKALPNGDLSDNIINGGPNSYLSSPTSGNAWSRSFLGKVLPMPEEDFRISADNYLCMLAPLYGQIGLITQPQGFYRLHGKNNFRGKNLETTFLNERINRYKTSCQILQQHLGNQCVHADIEKWENTSWLIKLQRSISDITSIVKKDETIILADENQWQIEQKIHGIKVVPFKEHQAEYWGPPESDADAIREIEEQKEKGATHIFFAWPAFWLLDHYKNMHEHLTNNYDCVIADERLMGFKLKSGNR